MIAIGCDHAGFELKNALIEALSEQGFEFKDMGCNGERCDYPVIAEAVCGEVTSGRCDKGILICGTGIGISLACNKVKTIRAACVSEPVSARLTKEHNNANIICFGARIVGVEMAKAIVDSWLETEYSNEERHQRRIDMISEIENQ